MQLAVQIAFYITFVVGAALIVRHKFHSRWRLFFHGAVLIVLASLAGGTIGGMIVLGHQRSAVVILIPGLLAGACEELARCIILYRQRQNWMLPDVLMFGIGFGGGEVIGRAVSLATGPQLHYSSRLYMAIACIEVFVFLHMCLTVIVHTQFVRHSGLAAFYLITGLALIYHVGMNFIAGMTAQQSLVYAVFVWLVVSPFPMALAMRSSRRLREIPQMS